MKKIYVLVFLLSVIKAEAQELYPSTEPASAMSAKSIGLRLNNKLFSDVKRYRSNPELMWGINKIWMVHLNLYGSDVYQSSFKFEGSNIYLKFSFFNKINGF